MDEFSDFQMAVHKPSPNMVNVGLPFVNGVPPGKTSTGIRFPDSSPVHSLASHSKSDLVRSQFSKPLVPPVKKFGTNVGSRLANYDLGLSVPTQNNIQGSMELSNPSKTINNPPVRSTDLLGEEDKYSALRMLIETEFSTTTSIFEKPEDKPNQNTELSTTTLSNMSSKTNSTIQPLPDPVYSSAPTINGNLMSALDFSSSVDSPAGDSSSDFGDFQSFTDFQSNTSTSVPSYSSPVVISNLNNFSSPVPVLPKLDLYASPPPIENGTCDSDGEFGDFVSVEPMPNRNPQPPTQLNWNQTFDLANLAVTQGKKECQNKIENLMDLTYFSKSTPENESYQPELKPVQDPDPSLTFSNFISHPIDQAPSVLDSLENETFGVEVKPPQVPVLSSSNFIRTSLIRNDEVTDIDPVKWNQSEDGNNDSALEFTSYERKDFNGKSKFLDISPETRSIASLDLGSYVTVDYSEVIKSSVDQQMVSNQINSSKSSASTAPAPLHLSTDEPTIYDDYDKYQCFRETCKNEKGRYCTEWNRCLKACKEMISYAFSVFNGVSTSEVIREVVADEKGYSYVMNMLEIYRVSQRIQKSSERLSLDSQLGNIFVEINNLWETLSAFLLGTCVSTEICQEISDEFSQPRESLPSCGVCLCSVDTTQSSQYLDYGGKMYHCQCANFWVNEVDAILPSLSFVSNAGSQLATKFDKASLV